VCLGWVKGQNESSDTSHVQYGSIQDWYWGVSTDTVHWIYGTGRKTVWKSPCFCVNRTASSRLVQVCLGWVKGSIENSYISHDLLAYMKDWYWWGFADTNLLIHGRHQKLSENCHNAFCVSWPVQGGWEITSFTLLTNLV
jgi:hypothetical protein